MSFVTYIPMQLAFGAAESGGSGTLWFEIIGFVSFLAWLASVTAIIVGIVGTVVWGVRQIRNEQGN